MTDEDLRAEIARLRAGESDALLTAGVALTPGEWIRLWNDLTPECRLKRAAIILGEAERASRCFHMDHDGEIEELRERLARKSGDS